MTNPKLLRKLVERYYANQATAEEIAVFVELQQDGLLDKVLNEYLDEQINEQTQQTEHSEKTWLPRRQVWKYAASISMLLLAAYLLAIGLRKKEDYITIQTDQYKEKRIELSDGSVVTLNRNSAFSYPKKWAGNAREVKLESGEAYFQITKNKEYKSFVVHMPDKLDIGVLGTTFNAVSRSGETRIYLETGQINIDCQGKKAHLKPGELAYFNITTKQLEVRPGNGQVSLAWKDNMFFFDDAPLSQVTAALEDFYHQNILIESSHTAELRFTGKMSRSDMDAVLTIISRTLQIQIRAENHPDLPDDQGALPQLSD